MNELMRLDYYSFFHQCVLYENVNWSEGIAKTLTG
mgnify:CR=1 FL=1|jgi:hypothetical protein